jgi:hypothetical protein
MTDAREPQSDGIFVCLMLACALVIWGLIVWGMCYQYNEAIAHQRVPQDQQLRERE